MARLRTREGTPYDYGIQRIFITTFLFPQFCNFPSLATPNETEKERQEYQQMVC